jgi:hypothetical protein
MSDANEKNELKDRDFLISTLPVLDLLIILLTRAGYPSPIDYRLICLLIPLLLRLVMSRHVLAIFLSLQQLILGTVVVVCIMVLFEPPRLINHHILLFACPRVTDYGSSLPRSRKHKT